MRCLGYGRWCVLAVGTVLSVPFQTGSAQDSTASRNASIPLILDISTPDADFGVLLTAEQRMQLLAIRDQYAPQLKALIDKRRKNLISQDSVQKGIQKLSERQYIAMIAVLTPEQRAQANATFAARQQTLADAQANRPLLSLPFRRAQ